MTFREFNERIERDPEFREALTLLLWSSPEPTFVPHGVIPQIRETHPMDMKETDKHNTWDLKNSTYYCGNCGCPRHMDAQFNVEECPCCHDDEFNKIQAEMNDIP